MAIEIAFVPLMVAVVPLKVCVPDNAVKVPSFWRFPPKIVLLAIPVSFQLPPASMRTLPVKVFSPVVARVSVPSTVVVPGTVKVPPVINVFPVPILRELIAVPMVNEDAVVTVAVPFRVRLFPIVEVALRVVDPALPKVRL